LSANQLKLETVERYPKTEHIKIKEPNRTWTETIFCVCKELEQSRTPAVRVLSQLYFEVCNWRCGLVPQYT